METRRLGTSEPKITPIGIGARAIGGGWNGSLGPQNERDSVPAIPAAWDRGRNWIDTAVLYGLGHSEPILPPRTGAGTFPISKNPCFLAISNWSNACERSAIGHGRFAGKVAIAWSLDHPAVTGAIVGFRGAKQASQVMAAEFSLLPAEMAENEEALTPESAA